MIFNCHGYVQINIMIDKDCYFNFTVFEINGNQESLIEYA